MQWSLTGLTQAFYIEQRVKVVFQPQIGVKLYVVTVVTPECSGASDGTLRPTDLEVDGLGPGKSAHTEPRGCLPRPNTRGSVALPGALDCHHLATMDAVF